MTFIDQLIFIVQYIFLGFVQGFTEPIPISSSGHLVIIQSLFGLKLESLTFEILVNFGSLIAVLIIYWQDIVRLAANAWRFLFKRDQAGADDFKFVIYLVIATIPAGLMGVLVGDQIASIFSTAKTTGISLIITAIALWMIRNLRGKKADRDLTLKDAIIIGLAQSVALIPGISRSGATIVAAMLLGMKRPTALRFSFLLYIPVSLGTMLLSLDELMTVTSSLWIPYLLAFITAGIASYYALRWFMNIMNRGNLIYFSIYCLIIGVLAFLIL